MERAFLAKIATRFLNFKISNFCNNKTNKEFACPSDLQIRVTMQKILNQRIRVWEKWILSKNNKPCPSLEGDLVTHLSTTCRRGWMGNFPLGYRMLAIPDKKEADGTSKFVFESSWAASSCIAMRWDPVT